ncbi:MAG: dynamin family protein [Methylococcales bacterium]|nr:dynamin family protein [Methylococcales bacterium]
MSIPEFKTHLDSYAQWRGKLIDAVEMYREWRQRYDMSDPQTTQTLLNIIDGLNKDHITLAFVGEFSRGKTELINALFFGDSGLRLLPSTPGRTTMCPTEIFYDSQRGNAIYLLDIDTRLEDKSLAEYKQNLSLWQHHALALDTPEQMQEAFKQLVATKPVPLAVAKDLGLWSAQDDADNAGNLPEAVNVPCWRHAMISFAHPLLQQGLVVLDTPGLNALGTEPELTLSMLPSAHAIIFVLAADTGVTKSDLDIWIQHVRGTDDRHHQGLAVVLNKIDAMWDDLTGQEGYQEAIRSQINSCATTLKIQPERIFPASAKQALLGKVKDDSALLEQSQINGLITYLSEQILMEKQQILARSMEQKMGFLLSGSLELTNHQLRNIEKNLEEFHSMDFQNQDMIKKLMTETRDQQQHYLANVESFQASRKIFTIQAKMLIEALAPERIDPIVSEARKNMAASLTTYGMKQNMRKLFDDLRDVLQNAVETTNETRRLIKAIHRKFHDEHGFKEVEPNLFSIKAYQFELEQIFEQGDAFRNSTRTTMTEQSVVIRKLYSTLIYRARKVLKQAHHDALTWNNSVLTPLMHQIKDYKKQIESRLTMLRKIDESTGSVAEQIAELEAKLEPLKKQRHELNTLISAMNIDLENLAKNNADG